MQPNYRRCISCQKVALKQDFWRIVRVYPSQELQLNQGAGRSAYLCPQASCLQAAQKRNRLGRSLKVSVPPEFYQVLWQHLHMLDSTTNGLESKVIPQPSKHIES